MSQASNYSIANATGAAVRSDLNDVFSAIVSQNSGATEPTVMYAYMLWADTTTTKLKMRNGANSAWIEVGTLDQTGLNIVASKFPNVTTNVTLSSAQMNDAVYLPSGTKMIFFQASAPTGWSQDTSNNDKALRVVSTSGGGTGGTTGFKNLTHSHTGSGGSTVAPTQSHYHGTATSNGSATTYLSADQLISRQRGGGAGIGNNNYEYNLGGSTSFSNVVGRTTSTGGSSSHSHSVTVDSATISPKYIDVIVCSKD